MKKLFLLPILFFVLGCQDKNNDDLSSQDLVSSTVAGLAQISENIGEDLGSLEETDVNNEIDIDGDSLNDEIDAIEAAVADFAANPDAISEETFDDSLDSFLKIHDNTAWKMIEETFTEYTLFYNSEESFIKVHDFNGCNDSLQSNIITDLGIYIQVNLNTNTVTFEYFADEDYIERVEGIYRDTLSRVESTADALWSKLGCD